jgi:hypothetical protein
MNKSTRQRNPIPTKTKMDLAEAITKGLLIVILGIGLTNLFGAAVITALFVASRTDSPQSLALLNSILSLISSLISVILGWVFGVQYGQKKGK